MHTEKLACSKQTEIESKFKKDEKVFIKHTKGKVEATVQTMFRLLTEKGIVNHALVFINEKTKLYLVVEEDDLMPFKHEIEKTKPLISEKRYYLVEYKLDRLEQGMIFCIFEDPKCQNGYIIYSKDLSMPIMGDTKINDEINKRDLNFKRIDENIAKHLYPIQPIINRLYVDLNLIDSLKKGSFVKFNESLYVHIHEKVEIGGYYFYFLHVCVHFC